MLYPPIDLDRFQPGRAGEGYLFVSELTGYKRADLVVEVFRGLDRHLTVVGDGPDFDRLRRIAPPNVTLTGRLPDQALAAEYAKARALIFPAEEDFGLTPVEAMAAGRPVLALGRGGALETVKNGETGFFFPDQTAASIRKVIDRFEGEEARFDPTKIRAHAESFSKSAFRARFTAAVDDLMAAPPQEAWR